MADFTFFFNPMSRAQIARWALHEVGADYNGVHVAWDAKPPELLAANPLGKLPTIIHHAGAVDHAVSEAAAICHYLAEVAGAGLLPGEHERADYFRMMFLAAGPVEFAVTTKAMGWQPSGVRQEMTVGFGSFDRVIGMLEGWFADRAFVCGERFTMADVYVGSQIDWGLQFGTMPTLPNLAAYRGRIVEREAYKAAKSIDLELIAQAAK